jgi:hypothetical protein
MGTRSLCGTGFGDERSVEMVIVGVISLTGRVTGAASTMLMQLPTGPHER